MIINLQETIKDLKGNTYTQKYVEHEEGKDPTFEIVDATIGIAIRDCVTLEGAATKELDEENVLTRLDIYEKIKGALVADFTDKEIIFIKDLILERYNAIIAAQYIRILNK